MNITTKIINVFADEGEEYVCGSVWFLYPVKMAKLKVIIIYNYACEGFILYI